MFRLEIDCSNAAFEGDNKPFEVARLLRVAALRVESGDCSEFPIKDFNGNKVGVAGFTTKPSYDELRSALSNLLTEHECGLCGVAPEAVIVARAVLGRAS